MVYTVDDINRDRRHAQMDWARMIRALVDFIMQIVAYFKKSDNTEAPIDEIN